MITPRPPETEAAEQPLHTNLATPAITAAVTLALGNGHDSLQALLQTDPTAPDPLIAQKLQSSGYSLFEVVREQLESIEGAIISEFTPLV